MYFFVEGFVRELCFLVFNNVNTMVVVVIVVYNLGFDKVSGFIVLDF